MKIRNNRKASVLSTFAVSSEIVFHVSRRRNLKTEALEIKQR